MSYKYCNQPQDERAPMSMIRSLRACHTLCQEKLCPKPSLEERRSFGSNPYQWNVNGKETICVPDAILIEDTVGSRWRTRGGE
jgi:hypothetical protein